MIGHIYEVKNPLPDIFKVEQITRPRKIEKDSKGYFFRFRGNSQKRKIYIGEKFDKSGHGMAMENNVDYFGSYQIAKFYRDNHEHELNGVINNEIFKEKNGPKFGNCYFELTYINDWQEDTNDLYIVLYKYVDKFNEKEKIFHPYDLD